MTAVFLAAASAWAGCADDLDLALQKAEVKFALDDVVALDEALRGAREALACVDAPIRPEVAARLHRAEAFAAWVHGDPARAEQHLAGMVSAAPLLRLDPVVPVNHPLELHLVAIEEAHVAPSRPLPWPEQGGLLINGVPSSAAPTDRPWVFQHAMGQRVSRTAWVDVGAAPPPYAVADGARPENPSRGSGRAWTIGGVAMGAVAGALYGAAWVGNGQYHAAVDAGDNDAISRWHGTTNGLTIGSSVAAGAGASLLVVGLTR